MSYDDDGSAQRGFIGIILLGIVLIAVLALWGCPTYNVYSSEMGGKAEYVKAEQNRRISVLEAQSKLDSAKLLNQADVERAKGVAQANQIIGDSLKDNEQYLRYLWIQGLESTENQIIYIPTEGGLPVLEAGRGVQITVENDGQKQ